MAEDGGGGGGSGYEGGADFDNTVQEFVITGQELCYPIVDPGFLLHTPMLFLSIVKLLLLRLYTCYQTMSPPT